MAQSKAGEENGAEVTKAIQEERIDIFDIFAVCEWMIGTIAVLLATKAAT